MSWQEIWHRKGQIDKPSAQLGLNDLIRISGFDTGAGAMSESLWRTYVRQIQDRLNITATTQLCEIGCGAGAFLYPLYEQDINVAGIDYSSTSIDVAKRIMPGPNFQVGEANQLPFEDSTFDVVLCSSVFHYFPDQAYARQVVQEMQRITKADGQIAILDVPDLAKRTAAEAYRQGELSPAEYSRLYADYKHLYYEKAWFQQVAKELNLQAVLFEQSLPGYGNGPYRFNTILRRSGSDHVS